MGRAIVNDPASCSIHFQHNAFIATLAQWLPTSTVSTCWRAEDSFCMYNERALRDRERVGLLFRTNVLLPLRYVANRSEGSFSAIGRYHLDARRLRYSRCAITCLNHTTEQTEKMIPSLLEQ